VDDLLPKKRQELKVMQEIAELEDKKLKERKLTTSAKASASLAITNIKQILEEFDAQVIKDTDQLRRYITNKLVQISNCGVSKEELRALELLGKISDIGLFVEKSEIKVTHTTSATLEASIKERIGRLMEMSKKDEGRVEEVIEDAEYEEVPEDETDDEELEE
jgi:hypothetical protein